jgi:hypothetical protein
MSVILTTCRKEIYYANYNKTWDISNYFSGIINYDVSRV